MMLHTKKHCMDPDRIREFDAFHTRAWVLLLLRALNKAGLAPCSNRVFHRVLFFGNTLARIYEFDPPAELVMRHPRGPYYPKAQADLDWLCVASFASLQDVSYEVVDGITTRHAIYDITDKGFTFINKCIEDVVWMRESARFLDDLALAFSTLDLDKGGAVESKDFTYQKATSEPNPIIYFGTIEENRSYGASEEIRDLIPIGLRPVPQTSLRLYIQYLDSIAA
jgi:hypothetical protein